MARKTPRKSITRFQARELEQKFMPAIKMLSKNLHKTSNEVPLNVFHGYVIPAGTLTSNNGMYWQLQVKAVCSKKEFIKHNELKPIIRRWAIGFKIRLLLKTFIDSLFE